MEKVKNLPKPIILSGCHDYFEGAVVGKAYHNSQPYVRYHQKFHLFEPENVFDAVIAFLRPHLEYAQVIWSLKMRKLVKTIEKYKYVRLDWLRV